MRNIIFITAINLFCFVYTINIKAQYNIGYACDINNQQILNWVDRDYTPSKSLHYIASNHGEFSMGYYIDKENIKHEGKIKLPPSNSKIFYFKKLASTEADELKQSDCKVLKIGLDSLVALSMDAVSTINKNTSKTVLAEILGSTDNYTFYKYTKANNFGITKKYVLTSKSESKYYILPQYSTELYKFFKNDFTGAAELKKFILQKCDKNIKVEQLAKLVEYRSYALNNRSIYFNKNHQEIGNSYLAQYRAEFVSLLDSIFHVKYYDNKNNLLREGYYTKFYPHTKTGLYTWYYANGNKRKVSTYNKNSTLTSETYYYPNGKINFILDYNITKNTDEINFSLVKYSKVNDFNGNSVLDSLGNGSYDFYDSINDRNTTFLFKKHKLKYSYYTENGTRIYLTKQQLTRLKGLKKLNERLYKDDLLSRHEVSRNTQGLVLVAIRLNEKGKSESYKIVKGINAFVDLNINSFFNENLKKIKWSIPYTANPVKFKQEIIIPLIITINGISYFHQSSNYYYNHWHSHWHWHMQQNQHWQQLQQQHMQQQMMQMQQNMYRPSF